MRSRFSLRALWVLQLGLTLGAFALHFWVGVVFTVFAFGVPILGFIAMRHGIFDPDKLAVLERPGHPELFKLVDDAAAQIGTPTFDRLYVANEANAWATRVSWRRSVIIGMPNLPFYTVADLRSTLAHEIAHHSANDIDDPELSAFQMLTALGSIPFYPLFLIARALAKMCAPAAAENSRERERAADFWASLVAGRGSLEAGLRTEGRVAVLWEWFERDLHVLAEAKQRPKNAYTHLRNAWSRADDAGYLCDIDEALESGKTLVDDTHPSFRERVDDNDRLCAGLELPERSGIFPVTPMFHAMEALELELTECLDDHDESVAVEDDELDQVFAKALDAYVRKRLEKIIGPRAQTCSAIELLSRAAPELTKRAKGFADDEELRESPMRKLLARTIDLAVARGELHGSFRFGSARTVQVGDEEWYAWHAAKLLLRGDVPWHALSGVTFGATGPQRAREISAVHPPRALPQAAKG